MKPGTMAILLLAAMALPPRLMQADTYAFKVLDVPGSPTGINNSGQIVTTDGVLESDGTFTPIRLPGSTETFSLGINDAGQVVGAFATRDLTSAGIAYLGFLDNQGIFTEINPFINAPPPFLGAYYAFATGVNNAAQVAGISSLGGHMEDGFLYQQGVLTSIDTPGHRLTEFQGINDAGQILGVGGLGPEPDTIFLYSNATFTPVTPGVTVGPIYGGPFPASPSPGSDINDAGQIVGTVYPAPFGTETEGFLYANGLTHTIDFPGATSTSVTGINNAGQIVGSFIDENGTSHGFIATPVPEPASLLLFVSGAFAIAILKRRPKRE